MQAGWLRSSFTLKKIDYYPIFLIIIYGVLRFLSTGFAELREFVFVKVTYNAVSEIALKVFRTYIGYLELSFIKKLFLTRELERGIRGISTIVNFTFICVLPILEVLLQVGLL